MLWQTNRADDNNITDCCFRIGHRSDYRCRTLAPSNRSAWECSGLLFSWEPFDFGFVEQRWIGTCRAESHCGSFCDTFRRGCPLPVNAYLTVLAAEQTVQAARRSGARETFTSVRVLVDISFGRADVPVRAEWLAPK